MGPWRGARGQYCLGLLGRVGNFVGRLGWSAWRLETGSDWWRSGEAERSRSFKAQQLPTATNDTRTCTRMNPWRATEGPFHQPGRSLPASRTSRLSPGNGACWLFWFLPSKIKSKIALVFSFILGFRYSYPSLGRLPSSARKVVPLFFLFSAGDRCYSRSTGSTSRSASTAAAPSFSQRAAVQPSGCAS